jgi:CheY-like chemotaxis protein
LAFVEAYRTDLAPQEPPMHVLLAEDNDELRGAVAGQLARLGYTVTEAADGAAALAACQARAEAGQPPFDLLLTDVMMPLLGGADLARAIERRWPDTAIVFMSGFTDEAALDPRHPLLPKPFRRQLLEETLRHALAARAARNGK